MKLESILRQENISAKELFRKALEKDLSEIKSGGQSGKRVSVTRGKASLKALISRIHYQESTARQPSVVATSPESSSDRKRPGKRKKMDEASNSSAGNNAKADAAKENDTNPGAHEMQKILKVAKKRSGVKPLNKGTLRRSQRDKVKEKIADLSENCEIEHPIDKSNDLVIVIDEKDTKTEGEKQHDPLGMKHGKKKQLKEMVTAKTVNRKSVKKDDLRIQNSPFQLTQKLSPERYKQKDAELKASVVTSEQSKGRDNRHAESGIPHAAEKAAYGDSTAKRRKKNGLTQAEIKDAELARQAVINELLKHNLMNLGEPQRQNLRDETTVSSTSRSMNQNCLEQKEDKSKQEHMSLQSPTRYHMLDENGDSSSRKTRVMQSLGLIAPSGSPFHRNGKV